MAGAFPMAYLTVTTPFDVVDPGDGQVSLREALTLANSSSGPDTIRFSAAVVGQTLVLTGGELSITNDLIIDGNNGGAAAQTTIDANQASRVLSITGGGTEARLSGLQLTNGRSYGERGGGIFLGRVRLTLSDCTISGNNTGKPGEYTSGDGGGIYAGYGAELVITASSLVGNSTRLFSRLLLERRLIGQRTTAPECTTRDAGSRQTVS